MGEREDANCKGSWALGTACKQCERCRDEAITLIPKLLETSKKVDRMRELVRVAEGASPALQQALFSEVREVLKS